jgi:hypothetical protein
LSSAATRCKISGFAPTDAQRPSGRQVSRTWPTPDDRAVKPPKARQPRVRTADGQVGTTKAMPDDHVLITLQDGRSFVVDADQLKPQDDGTYLI